LLIKREKIKDEKKLVYVNQEIKNLEEKIGEKTKYVDEMKKINLQLWEINEKRKEAIAQEKFDQIFLELSIEESKLNDARFLFKQKVDKETNSNLQEQKSYKWA
jgi:hypothetical protein